MTRVEQRELNTRARAQAAIQVQNLTETPPMAEHEHSYTELDTVPAYVAGEWVEGRLVNRDAPVKWGGKEPPPAIGDEIVVTINRCGPAVVTGYFVEDGWLGLKCRLHNPPEWHVKQNKGDPNGHVFGPEWRRPGWLSVEGRDKQWYVQKPDGSPVNAGPWPTQAEADKALGYLAWVAAGGSAD